MKKTYKKFYPIRELSVAELFKYYEDNPSKKIVVFPIEATNNPEVQVLLSSSIRIESSEPSMLQKKTSKQQVPVVHHA